MVVYLLMFPAGIYLMASIVASGPNDQPEQRPVVAGLLPAAPFIAASGDE
jgi:hypothetical protein